MDWQNNLTEKEKENLLTDWRSRYRIKSLDELDITDTPGYWEYKQSCEGRGKCSSPLHNFMFCEEGTKHTVTYFEYGYRGFKRDSRGRCISPTILWKKAKGLIK